MSSPVIERALPAILGPLSLFVPMVAQQTHGSAQAYDKTVTLAQSVTFPVSPSADGRYLQDARGIPFPILGRTAWFITSLTPAEYKGFLDDTAAKLYTAIEFHVINHDGRGNHPPFAGNGALPFLKNLNGAAYTGGLNGTADFTTPNEAYWAYVDSILADAESKGLLAFMFPEQRIGLQRLGVSDRLPLILRGRWSACTLGS